MKPVEFKEQNTVFAKNQPQYLPLPVYLTQDGVVISCWRLSWWERLKLLYRGRLWLMQLTFNNPLQPQLLKVNRPFPSCN